MISEKEKNLRDRRKTQRNKKIINLYTSYEYSLRDLGKIFNISHQRVHDIIRRAGIDGTGIYMERNRRRYVHNYCEFCGAKYRITPSRQDRRKHCSLACAKKKYTTDSLVKYVKKLYHKYGKIDVKLIRKEKPPGYSTLKKYLGRMKEIRTIAKGEKDVST